MPRTILKAAELLDDQFNPKGHYAVVELLKDLDYLSPVRYVGERAIVVAGPRSDGRWLLLFPHATSGKHAFKDGDVRMVPSVGYFKVIGRINHK